MEHISNNFDLKFHQFDIKKTNFKNNHLQRFFDITLIRLPLQSSYKKKTISEVTPLKKEVEHEKQVLKPIANSFLVNNDNDSQNDSELYLKKESLSQKSNKGKCLIF